MIGSRHLDWYSTAAKYACEDKPISSTTERTIPGPSSLTGFRTLRAFQKSPMQFLQRLAADHGDIAAFGLGPARGVLVNHPELVREVLVAQKEKFPKLGRQTKTIRLIDGNSLFVKDGAEWLTDRRIIQSAFGPTQMPGYADDMLRITNDRTDQWTDGATIDFCDETTDLSILISGKIIFGADLNDRVERLRQMAYDRSDVFVAEMSAPFRIPDHWPLPSKRRKQNVIDTMDDVIYGIMRGKREKPESEDKVSANPDLLEILFAASDSSMSDSQIRDHANLLFQAGVDDIATAMVWMFYLIAGHPEIQSRIKREIADVTSGEPIRSSDLGRFEFIERVVNETLRLYPSTWIFTARKTAADTTLGGDATVRYPVKHRDWIFISPYVTQRDSRFFENPDSFHPDRFLPERFGKPQQAAFFPFGIGPRACAGAKFSIMELVLVAATVLQKFSLERAPGMDDVGPVPKVTVRPAQAILLDVHRDDDREG